MVWITTLSMYACWIRVLAAQEPKEASDAPAVKETKEEVEGRPSSIP